MGLKCQALTPGAVPLSNPSLDLKAKANDVHPYLFLGNQSQVGGQTLDVVQTNAPCSPGERREDSDCQIAGRVCGLLKGGALDRHKASLSPGRLSPGANGHSRNTSASGLSKAW